MKFIGNINGKEKVVEIEKTEESMYQITIGGETKFIEVLHDSGDTLSMISGNEPMDVFYHKNDDYEVNFKNVNYEIELFDYRTRLLGKNGFDSGGADVLKSMMPGKVVQIEVKEGQKVKAGDGIIIIEAMKMENELKCKEDGVVKKVYVKEGDTIEKNSKLVEIEAETTTEE